VGLDVAAYSRDSGAAYRLREKWVRDDVAFYARDSRTGTMQATTSPTHFSRSGYEQKREKLKHL